MDEVLYFSRPMSNVNMPRITLFVAAVVMAAGFVSCSALEGDGGSDDRPAELDLPDGFAAEVLYDPMQQDSSSWVALATDGQGRLLASDQYGALYRITPHVIGGDPDETHVEKLDLEIGHAQGLLWAFNSLYVVVNSEEGVSGRSSGLYRVIDSDNDAELDSIMVLAQFEGWGEHGPHGIVQGPDGTSLYLVAGNHTELPESYRAIVPEVWQEDQLIDVLRDPRGHAADRPAPGGWIVRTDSLGSKWDLISVGFRNAYDLAFTPTGELFTFDSDMEWDLGMPWYRPIRVIHVTSGSEYGWRTGSGKWPEYYPDNLPGVVDIDQGSPTGIVSTAHAAFPVAYRQGMLVFDWSFGTIYYVKLTQTGSSYSGQVEEFLSGVPLPVTDGVIGHDGALYFATGGRRLNSYLYRVYHETSARQFLPFEPQLTPQQGLRRRLEEFHTAPASTETLDQAWAHMGHADRHVRYAARIAVEHQPVDTWRERAFSEPDPDRRIQAIIAVARHAEDVSNGALNALLAIPLESLSRSQELDFLRAAGLVLLRQGEPDASVRAALIARLNPRFPTRDDALDREYGRLLATLEAPGIAEKMLSHLQTLITQGENEAQLLTEEVAGRSEQYGEAITEMRANPPSPQEIDLVMNLRNVTTGWTLESRRELFTWFYDALRRSGGRSYVGFIEDMRADVLEHLTEEERAELGGLADASFGQSLADLPQPEGPARKWNRQEIQKMLNDELGTPRDLEHGQRMFAAALCSTCHRFGETGGSIGPDLTAVGTRFNRGEILEAIDSPSDAISDQYAAQILTRFDGTSMVGRIVDEDRETITFSANPYDPSQNQVIEQSLITGREDSPVSIMPSRLLDRLNEAEVADLIAYLLSGGDPEHKCYTGDEGCQTRDEEE